MIDIQWKGKIGYGDIISPICYAHNVSYKLKTKVSLTFRWHHSFDEKVHRTDPETLWERAMYINYICSKMGTDVGVYNRFDSPLDINHTNYDWNVLSKDIFHNYWSPVTKNKPLTNIIVVNSTAGNLQSLAKYGKSWKDPVAGRWDQVVEDLSNKYDVFVVDYRTPIVDLVNVLRVAKGFVGYHGTAAWVAKFTHTPSVLFADLGSLTRNAFHYASLHEGRELDQVLVDLDHYIEKSRQRIEAVPDLYQKYEPDQMFRDHLVYG